METTMAKLRWTKRDDRNCHAETMAMRGLCREASPLLLGAGLLIYLARRPGKGLKLNPVGDHQLVGWRAVEVHIAVMPIRDTTIGANHRGLAPVCERDSPASLISRPLASTLASLLWGQCRHRSHRLSPANYALVTPGVAKNAAASARQGSAEASTSATTCPGQRLRGTLTCHDPSRGPTITDSSQSSVPQPRRGPPSRA